LQKRRRFKQTASFEERLSELASGERAKAQRVPESIEKYDMLKKVRQAEMAADFNAWAHSLGSQQPKPAERTRRNKSATSALPGSIVQRAFAVGPDETARTTIAKMENGRIVETAIEAWGGRARPHDTQCPRDWDRLGRGRLHNRLRRVFRRLTLRHEVLDEILIWRRPRWGADFCFGLSACRYQ